MFHTFRTSRVVTKRFNLSEKNKLSYFVVRKIHNNLASSCKTVRFTNQGVEIFTHEGALSRYTLPRDSNTSFANNPLFGKEGLLFQAEMLFF